MKRIVNTLMLEAPAVQFNWAASMLLALAGIGIATGIFSLIRNFLGEGDTALLYLPAVALIAGIGGARSGLVAAVLGFLAGKFFFVPPYYTFSIRDPKDWISMMVFVVIGLAMGMQAGKIRQREDDALSRERESALLYRLSSHLASQEATPAMASTLLKEVLEATGAESSGLFLPDVDGDLRTFLVVGDPSFGSNCAPPDALACYERSQRLGAGAPEHVDGRSANDLYLPLRSTTKVEGVLYIGARSDGSVYAQRDRRLLTSITHLAAAFLERQRLQSAVAQADALRETDRMKSTLVSSVSHELKTPLSSVTATVTNLLESDLEWEPDRLRRDLEVAAEDLKRLNYSIGSLLDLSRLESGAWTPKREWCDLGEILGTSRSRIPRLARSRITIKLPEDLPPIYVDYPQWVRALMIVLENALAYSPEDRPVRVSAQLGNRELRVHVEDEGPGVHPEERERIFEKFFRGHAANASPSGTGLGLAIAQEILHFHGGRIEVEEAPPHGARFSLILPLPVTSGVAAL